MFNNRFNSTKKDPLVEAVQIAMQDGEIRRQAEALVNEAFGVYNRNAVVREELAAYDAAIEEAYRCVKEGNKENKEKKRDVEASTGAAYKKMGFDGRGSKGRHPENKRHDDIGLGRKVMKFGEGNDGNLANNYPPYDKVTRGDVIAGATGKDQMGGKKKKMEEEEQIDEIKVSTADSYLSKRTEQARKGLLPGDHNPTSKTELKNMKNAAERTDKDYYKKRGFKKMEEGTAEAETSMNVTRDNKPSTPAQTNAATSGPSAADKAALTSKIKTMKEAVYSAKAARAGKDIGKPGKQFKKIAAKAGKKYGSEERGKKVAGAILARIRAKHMKEAIGTSQYGTATGSSFAAIDKARNAPSAGAPRPTARPDQTSINKLSSSRGLADSGSKYAGGKPHSSSTFSSTAPGAQAKVQSSKTERGWADPGKYENEVKAKTGSMQQIRQGKVQEPSTQLGTPKGGESSTQSFLSKQLGRSSANAQGPEAPQTPQQRWDASRQASNQPSPGVAARTASAEIASGADKARDNSASVKKLMSMNESVQVGANRYRIV